MEENFVDLLDDRHFHTVPLGELPGGSGAVDAFYDLMNLFHRFFWSFSGAD